MKAHPKLLVRIPGLSPHDPGRVLQSPGARKLPKEPAYHWTQYVKFDRVAICRCFTAIRRYLRRKCAWMDGPEAAHLAADRQDRLIDVGVGGPPPQAQAQRALRQMAAAPQSAQHIGGIPAGRTAGGTGGERKLGETGHEALPLHALERHRENVWDPHSLVTVQVHAAQPRKPAPEPIAQARETFRLDRSRAGEHAGDSKSDHLMSGQRAGPQAPLLPAAKGHRAQTGAALRAHIERANSLGAIELVRREAQEIDRQSAHVEGELPRRLRRIGMEQNAAFGAERAEGCDVCDDAGLIVDLHEADEHGVGADRSCERLGRDPSGTIRRQIRHGIAFFFQVAAGIEHRTMLDAGRDDVPAAVGVGARDAQDREVVRLRGAGGEDDLGGLGADQRCDFIARALDARLRAPAKLVSARGGIGEIAVCAQAFAHRLSDERIHRRRRRIVQINGRRPHEPRVPAGRRRFCTAEKKPRRMLTSFSSGSARCRSRRKRAMRCVPLSVRSRKSTSSSTAAQCS